MFANLHRWIACLLAVLLVRAELHAQPRGEEPPVVGRPANFSHVVGDYKIALFTAQPTELAVEDPITVTILISGKGPLKYQPNRALLHLFDDDIDHDFFIEPVPQQDRVYHWRHRGRRQTWQFVYRFRPKSTNVTELPLPRLSYYRPGWGFATAPVTNGKEIRLVVKPRAELKREDVGDLALPASERLYHVIGGEQVLARDEARPCMTLPMLLGVGLGAPAMSWLVLMLWQRLVPDGHRRLQRRRSQAARRALRELGRAGSNGSADVLAGILSGYLSQRLDFSATEPTPADVARVLKGRGVSLPLRQQWTELFRDFDEARYTPHTAHGNGKLGDAWSTRAIQLILALEAEPCLACAR